MNEYIKRWIQENRLDIFRFDNEEFVIANEIARLLGYKHTKDAVTRHCINPITKKIKTNGGLQQLKLINQEDIKILISKSRMPEALNLAKHTDIEIQHIMIPTKSQEILDVVSKAFANHISIIEYRVGRYRIDLYFPELQLAIECDEHNHSTYDKNKEIIREKYIKNKLRCSFLRFNPDDINFNIGDLIYKINQYISNKIAI